MAITFVLPTHSLQKSIKKSLISSPLFSLFFLFFSFLFFTLMSQHPLGFLNISTNELCFSETCIQAASSLLSSLNMNVDPCSDFYEYACGNWIKQTIIPEDLTEFGILDVSAYQHKERLRTIFDGTYEDLLSFTRSLKSYQVDTKENKRVDKKNFKIIKDYFSSCVETQSELDVFLGDLKSLQRLDSHRDFELTEDVFRIVSEPEYSTDSLVINVGGLFTLEMNTMNKVLMLSPPRNFKDVEYQTKIDLVMSVLGTRNFTNRDQRRIAIMKTIDLVPLSNSEIYTMVDNTVSLQERLIELAESDPDAYYTYTLSKFKKLFPFINWEGMPLFDVPVQVYSLEYFKELSYYANIQDPTRPIHKQAITHLLLLNKILTEAPKLDSELRQIIPDSIFQTRASLCLEKCLERFGLAAGRFYAMIAFGGESDKLRLEKIAQHIKIALSDRIQNADWLDDSTKSSAIKKLRMMQTSIGYSTFSPDQRSPKDIHQFMFGLKTDYNTFYENDRAISLWRIKTYWDTLNKTFDSTAWIGVTTPQVVNAFNLLSQNSIFVSAGFAQKPNYDSHYPDYFNYAGIGQSIGHEYSVSSIIYNFY
ncbi:unnamed protein product [Rhizopus stolonifer]